MSYVPPARFNHGEYPTAANLNKYKTGMDAIHSTLGDVAINPAVPHREFGHSYVISHRWRWLLYLGSGRIDDPYEQNDSISLDGDENTWSSYDLMQVDWLLPGRVYQVEAVIACQEDYEAY